jgi:hypothetical protein
LILTLTPGLLIKFSLASLMTLRKALRCSNASTTEAATIEAFVVKFSG